MKYIPLSQGKTAIVDDEDFEYLSQWKWGFITNSAGRPYARRTSLPRVLMHRLIMKAPSHLEVDHIYGNTLDNRKSKLRVVTHTQNSWNREPDARNKSGYLHIHWSKNRWVVKIQTSGKIFRKRFTTLEEAIICRDKILPILHKNYYRLHDTTGERE